MSVQVRIGPVLGQITNEFLAEFLRKICEFSKMERITEFRTVILTFESQKEALDACEKLQGLHLQGRKISVSIIKTQVPMLPPMEFASKKIG